MAFLTDQILATGVTLDDLIHIVITGDTSQNPAGSSYKATIGQVLSNVPNFTGNTSGDCITDLFVSNIHSCSPLNINPLDEGNVYLGSTSGITFDILNKRIGINNDNPTYRLDILGTTGRLFYDGDTTRNTYRQSQIINSGSSTGITVISVFSEGSANGIEMYSIGSGVSNSVPWRFAGEPGDVALYASSAANNLNIMNNLGSGTTDNIRFYVGGSGHITGQTPAMIIIGSGSTKGFVGINNPNPTEKLDVSGKTKTTNFQMTSGATDGYVLTSDANGNASWESPLLFTGNTSGDCITDLFVSNIHSCSPLNINPNDEGNVYLGSTSGITFDIINNRLGINNPTPQYVLDISGSTNEQLQFIPSLTTPRLLLSTDDSDKLIRMGVNDNTNNGGIEFGFRGTTEPTFNGYGKQGDSFIRGSDRSNGLNIIEGPNGAKENYIRFYAGIVASTGNTPDIHIQGSGTTKGFVGINNPTPISNLHISGTSYFDKIGLTTTTTPSFRFLDGISTPTETTTIKSFYKEFKPTTTSTISVIGDATLMYPNITTPSTSEYFGQGNLILYTDDLDNLTANEALTSEVNVVQIQSNTGTYNGLVKSSASVLRNLTSGGTIDKYIGFWMNGFDDGLTHNGATNNMYGFYMDSQAGRTGNITPASNRWGVYIADSGKNYFAGTVGIGESDPTERLVVNGNVVVSGNTTTGSIIVNNPYIPSGSTDPTGVDGTISWDSDSIYFKNNAGWVKITGNTSW